MQPPPRIRLSHELGSTAGLLAPRTYSAPIQPEGLGCRLDTGDCGQSDGLGPDLKRVLTGYWNCSLDALVARVLIRVQDRPT